jgi:hypothetical protein
MDGCDREKGRFQQELEDRLLNLESPKSAFEVDSTRCRAEIQQMLIDVEFVGRGDGKDLF